MRAIGCFALLGLVGALGAPAADDKPTQKEREATQKNLREIGLGFHNYADTHEDRWLDDVADKDGRPLLSWRVGILPYVGEEKLYKQFKLDEPWDSAHNKKLIDKMPKAFAPVRGKHEAGRTFYQRFVGKEALWDARGPRYTIPGVPDGTSNTALVVEGGDPVVWTQPADLPFLKNAPLPKLGGLFGGEFYLVLCDGSVYRVNQKFNADIMKLVIMPDDGMPIDFDKLSK